MESSSRESIRFQSFTFWFVLQSVWPTWIRQLTEARPPDKFHWVGVRSTRGCFCPAGSEHVWSACLGWCLNNPPPRDIWKEHINIHPQPVKFWSFCTRSQVWFTDGDNSSSVARLKKKMIVGPYLRSSWRPSFQDIWLAGSESDSAGPLGTTENRCVNSDATAKHTEKGKQKLWAEQRALIEYL